MKTIYWIKREQNTIFIKIDLKNGAIIEEDRITTMLQKLTWEGPIEILMEEGYK